MIGGNARNCFRIQLVTISIVLFCCFCCGEQSEEERQAELRERARKLLSEARKGSVTATTTEIIRVTQDDAEQKLQKLSEQVTQLEIQTNAGW